MAVWEIDFIVLALSKCQRQREQGYAGYEREREREGGGGVETETKPTGKKNLCTCWLFNVPATTKRTSRMALHRQFLHCHTEVEAADQTCYLIQP